MKVFTIRFLDRNDEVRSFIESGRDLDHATNKICDKLQSTPFFRCMSRDFMHVDTVEVI